MGTLATQILGALGSGSSNSGPPRRLDDELRRQKDSVFRGALEVDLLKREGTFGKDAKGNFKRGLDRNDGPEAIPTTHGGIKLSKKTHPGVTGIKRFVDLFDAKGNPVTDSPDELLPKLDKARRSAELSAQNKIPNFHKLDINRQIVVTGMIFQMGEAGVTGAKGFKDMLTALRKNPPDFDAAAEAILDSEFFKNEHGRGTPARAQAMADIMRGTKAPHGRSITPPATSRLAGG